MVSVIDRKGAKRPDLHSVVEVETRSVGFEQDNWYELSDGRGGAKLFFDFLFLQNQIAREGKEWIKWNSMQFHAPNR